MIEAGSFLIPGVMNSDMFKALVEHCADIGLNINSFRCRAYNNEVDKYTDTIIWGMKRRHQKIL